MTPLRKRMIDEMTIRNFTEATKKVYVQAVARYAAHFKQSPESLGAEDVRSYQLHLMQEDYSRQSVHVAVCAARFLYNEVLRRGWAINELPYPKKAKALPDVLSKAEVTALLATPTNLRDRAVLMTTFATGLRPFEVAGLRIANIDSSRMVIKVVSGKGRKDRYVMLSPALLELLREYWQVYKPREWLFPSQRSPDRSMGRERVYSICKGAAVDAGLKKNVNPRLIRHTFATHLLEDGTDIRVVQALLGHSSITSTMRYTRVSTRVIAAARSPLDTLKEPAPTPRA